ncbi:MAG: hypothetical protein J2P49_07010 [Methylocapsa sp.]|nr:hypothetical protein [Methylocapsa sp.]
MAPLATAALGDPAGVLVADETGVLKEGHLPEGVAARRNRRDPAKEAYDLVFAPAGTTFAELDGVSGLTLDRRRGI